MLYLPLGYDKGRYPRRPVVAAADWPPAGNCAGTQLCPLACGVTTQLSMPEITNK